MIEKTFSDFIEDFSSNLHSIVDFITEKPKKFYRKFRKGKKIYKTRKMFCYNPIKDMMIPPTMLAIKSLKRRLNDEK